MIQDRGNKLLYVGGTYRRRCALILYLLILVFIALIPMISRGQSLIPQAVGTIPIEAAAHRHAAIITINGPLDRISWVSVRRRIDEAVKNQNSLLIFKINSQGGLLEPALKIAALVRHAGVATVAWIDTTAIGPAALVAAACNKIVISDNSAWGDGQSYTLAGTEADHVAADPMVQLQSPALNSFQADQTFHPILILAAMMDRDIKIDEVRNAITGVTRFVSPKQRKILMNIQSITEGHAAEHPWVYVKRVKPSGTLLTLGAHDAVRMGAAAGVVEDSDSLPVLLNITAEKIPVLRLDFLERMSRFFSSIKVRFFLFVIMLICGYLEFSHPGLLIPAMIGLAALALFLGGPMLTGLANWWEAGIIFLGIVIIVFDFIHFGGLGLLAIPGFILAIVGMIASFVPMDASAAGAERAFQTGLGVVSLGMITAGAIIFVLIKYLNITPGFRRLQLKPVIAAHGGGVKSSSDALFVGEVGRTVSELRPAGKAMFDAMLVTVVSHGDFIARGMPVRIMAIRENQFIVQRLTDDIEPSAPTESEGR